MINLQHSVKIAFISFFKTIAFLGKFNPPTNAYLQKFTYKKIPNKINVNGEEIDMISKSDVNLKAGWYYDEDEKTLWIRSAVKNIGSNEWKITLN